MIIRLGCLIVAIYTFINVFYSFFGFVDAGIQMTSSDILILVVKVIIGIFFGILALR